MAETVSLGKILEEIKKLNEDNKKYKEEILTKFEETIKDFSTKSDGTEKELISLKEKIHKIENESKKKNFVIYNLEEKESNYFQLENCILSLINDGCRVSCVDIEIDFIKRLGKRSNKIRPVLVGLTTWRKKMMIMKSKKLLKGSNLRIEDDLPKDILKKQKELIPTMLKFREEGRKVFIKFDKIMVDGKVWSEDEDQSRHKRSAESSPEIVEEMDAVSPNAQTTNSAVADPGVRKKQFATRGKSPAWENSQNINRSNWWKAGNGDKSSTYNNQPNQNNHLQTSGTNH